MKRIVLWGVGSLLVFVLASAQAQNRGGPNFKGTLHVQSYFEGGGPTLIVENEHETGDVAIDFLSAGALWGNIVVIKEEEDNPRFAILQNNPAGLNLALVESGDGNVGVGTPVPEARLHIRSEFEGGGATLIVDNAHENGDVSIDFRSGDQYLANISVIGREVGEARLAILHSNDALMPLILVENGGNVGIGTANPQASLHMNLGDTANQDTLLIGDPSAKGFWVRDTGSAIDLVSLGVPLYVNSDSQQPIFLNPNGGIVTIGTPSPSGNYILEVVQGGGHALADGWDSHSSARWKTNVQPIEGALDKVRRLRGVSFDWKKKGTHDIGLIGEEVGQVIPEVVVYEENHKDAKSVDYSRLVAVLIEAIKEQQTEIDELKAVLKSLTVKSEGPEAQSVAVRHQ